MAIERWDPFREAVSLRDAMNTLFQESFVRPGGMPAPNVHTALPLDVSETEDAFVVKASLPGVKPDDVQITVQGDTLTIRGESKAEEEKDEEHWHLRERRFRARSSGPCRCPCRSTRTSRRPDTSTASSH